MFDLVAIESKLLTLKGKISPTNRIRNITFTLDTTTTTTTFIVKELANYFLKAEHLNIPTI